MSDVGVRVLSAEEVELLSSLPAVSRATELEQWRSGKRRVFWRVRWGNLSGNGNAQLDFASQRAAQDHTSRCRRVCMPDVKLFRVTVRPKGKP